MHDKKFAGNPAHRDCQPRFDQTIDNLSQKLAAAEASRMDFSASQSALPDALEPARQLQEQARQLETACNPEAVPLRELSRQILFKELNELDGFDR